MCGPKNRAPQKFCRSGAEFVQSWFLIWGLQDNAVIQRLQRKRKTKKNIFLVLAKLKIVSWVFRSAFEISRKTPITSNLPSKDFHILWVIDKSWLILESPGLK